MKKWIGSFVLAVLAFILILSASNSPWYYQYYEVPIPFSDEPVEYFTEYYLEDVDLEIESGNSTTRVTFDYDDEELESEGLAPVFAAANGIVVLAMILSFFLMLTILVSAYRHGKGGKIIVGLGVLAIIAVLAAAAYIAVGIPNAFNASYEPFDEGDTDKPEYTQSFIGEEEGISWGAGPGWYQAVIALILLIISVILAGSASKQALAEDERMEEAWLRGENPEHRTASPVNVQVSLVDTETLTLECPGCRKKFTAEIESRPAKVSCPSCGVEGNIK
jgi:amino acid transporter